MAPKSAKKESSTKKYTPQQASNPNSNHSNNNNSSNNPPNWPDLKPLVPASDLHLETLLDDQILIIRNLFTATLCKTYVSFLSTLPLVTTPGRPKKDEAVRVNDRFQVHDSAFAERLWSCTALKGLVLGEGGGDGAGGLSWGGEVLGLNPNIRIYRYGPGQFFDKHCKCFFFFFFDFLNIYQRSSRGGSAYIYIYICVDIQLIKTAISLLTLTANGNTPPPFSPY